jgi:hypothetical protein
MIFASRRVRPFLVRTIVFALVLVAAAAHAGWYDTTNQVGIKPSVPDFFQHQNIDADADWEKNGGWCYQVAAADALYALNTQPAYHGLYDTSATGPYPISDAIGVNTNWLDASSNAVRGLVAAKGVQPFLDARNHGSGAGLFTGLTYNQYWVDNLGDKTTKKLKDDGVVDGFTGDGTVKYFLPTKAGDPLKVAPITAAGIKAFDYYTNQLTLADGAKSVMVQIGKGTNTLGIPDVWWGNYHEVAGAGVDVTKRSIYFSDPDSNKGSKLANAGWNYKKDYAPAIARKYDPTNIAADKPVPLSNTLDDKFYGTWTVAADGFTVDGGVENPDRYTDTQIRKVETVSPSFAVILGRQITDIANNVRETTVKVTSLINKLVDKIRIAPASPIPSTWISGPDTPTDYDKSMGTMAVWSAAAYESTDPWGNFLPYGSAEFDWKSGSFLDSSGALTLAVPTQDSEFFDRYNVFLHYAGSASNDWDVQALGATNLPFEQFQVPEPATVTLLVIGGTMLFFYGRHRGGDRPYFSAVGK